MRKTLFGLSLGVGALLVATQHAYSQQRNCGTRDKVIEHLTGQYGEARQGMGLAANNAVVEVFASSETGTWTSIVTNTRGVTCLVASGQSFETEVDDLVPAKGEPT